MTEGKKKRLTWKLWLACGIVVLPAAAVVACFLFFLTACNDPNRIEVVFQNVPEKTIGIAVVVEVNGTVDSMWEVIRYVGSNTAVGPSAWQWHPHPTNNREWYAVRWKQGSRFGVVSQRNDKTWWVTWFDPEQVPIMDRSRVFGGGTVVFDLAKGQTQQFPPEKAKSLGLIGHW
jgi:hypothetical protein